MDRNNYGNYNPSGMRDRGERYTQRSGDREREQRNRAPRENGRGQSQRRNDPRRDDPRRDDPRRNEYRRDDPRSESFRSNNSRREYGSSSSLDNSQMRPAYVKENSFNKQYNTSSSSLATSKTNLLQSPFQNPYKIDSNASKTTIINDPSKDRLETYAKLKSISPVKFYISIIITVIVTAVMTIIGFMCISKNGLSDSNIKDVTPGMAQGYLFYCGFLLIAIVTGVYAFAQKWNNLLVTYLSFLFVSCLYLGYFTIELINIKTNTLEIMNNRWKDTFSDDDKSTIQNQLSCCGYYNADDDPGKSTDCINNDSARKRSFIGIFDEDDSPITYNVSRLYKRLQAEEGSCAEAIKSKVDNNMTVFIIIFAVLLLLNICAVVVTILDIKQYADILKELSNPFA